jgi:hypothetical protein
MNTAGANELGYASTAILVALMEELIASKLLSASTASNVLDKAVVSLKSFGSLTFVPGAVAVVGEIRRDLSKQGVK